MKLRINFKAVLVLIFGIFCLYFYFRLVYPYWNAGRPVETVSETVFGRRVIEINGDTYSYWTNSVNSPRKIAVMLPPSTATGDLFGKYAEIFPEDVLIIAPDYPGRGLTSSITAFDTAPLIAERVSVLLKEILGERSFDIIGPSFGGMIATELAKDSSLNINKIFLIATGEFFAPDQKFMYKALFNPARSSERIRDRYVSLLTGRSFVYNIQDSNIEDILEQWLTVIDYQINISVRSKVPAIIVVFDQDNVVTADSAAKLQKVFVNNTVINLDLTHTSENFFSPGMTKILTSNI